MTLINDAIKQTHPLASRIPQALWNELFKNQLDDNHADFETKTLAHIARNDLPDDSQAAFILILLHCQDNEPVDDLISYALNILELDDKSIYALSGALGRVDILDHLKMIMPDALESVNDNPEAEDMSNFYVLYWPFVTGQTQSLTWYDKEVPDALELMVKSQNFLSFYYAAEYGHCSVLEFIRDKAPEKFADMIAQNDYSPFKAAWNARYLDAVNFMLEDPACLAFLQAIKNTKNVENNYGFGENNLSSSFEKDHLSKAYQSSTSNVGFFSPLPSPRAADRNNDRRYSAKQTTFDNSLANLADDDDSIIVDLKNSV